MRSPDLVDYGLEFVSLTARDRTTKIVIHHTGNAQDDDLSAEQIHASHLMQGWAGIGYHYVIRKDGTVELGRPEWAVGAHAQGFNWTTLGIHLCGNFELVAPTKAQIESLAYLVGYLCEQYDLIPDPRHVVGHRDLMATACPGQQLYSMLQTIRGKAIWYQQHYK